MGEERLVKYKGIEVVRNRIAFALKFYGELYGLVLIVFGKLLDRFDYEMVMYKI